MKGSRLSSSAVLRSDARGPQPGRYAAVTRVLVRVLILNLGVAFAKIGVGYATGAVSMLSDGFHSLTDTASNVVLRNNVVVVVVASVVVAAAVVVGAVVDAGAVVGAES